MSVPNLDDSETTPSQGVVPLALRLPVEGQPRFSSASYGCRPSVGQVPVNSIVTDSTFFGYFTYKDLIKVVSYKRQVHTVKPKTSDYMLYASTMQTTIEQFRS